MTREFYDKLVDAHDRESFYLQMRLVLENLGFDILTLDDVVFGDFSKNRSDDTEYNECPPSHVKNLLKVYIFAAAAISYLSLRRFLFLS
jgi:hypothetical protein